MNVHIILHQQPSHHKSTYLVQNLLSALLIKTSKIPLTNNKPHHNIYQNMKASDYTYSHSSPWYNYIKLLKFQFQRHVISLVIAGCYLWLLRTLLPVFLPIISLGCSKTPCLHIAVNEWHSGMPLKTAAIHFNCDIFHLRHLWIIL